MYHIDGVCKFDCDEFEEACIAQEMTFIEHLGQILVCRFTRDGEVVPVLEPPEEWMLVRCHNFPWVH